jgi:hypothetical protein
MYVFSKRKFSFSPPIQIVFTILISTSDTHLVDLRLNYLNPQSLRNLFI